MRYFFLLFSVSIFLCGQAAASRFPQAFLGKWGEEGRRCGKVNTPQVMINRDALYSDGMHQRLLRIEVTRANVVVVKIKQGSQIRNEKLTIGTTGSRLFHERYGQSPRIYYRCE